MGTKEKEDFFFFFEKKKEEIKGVFFQQYKSLRDLSAFYPKTKSNDS